MNNRTRRHDSREAMEGYPDVSASRQDRRRDLESTTARRATDDERARALNRFKMGSRQTGSSQKCPIPPTQLSWENVGNMWQHVATYGTMCALKTHILQNVWIRGPSAKTPFVPTPSGSRRCAAQWIGSSWGRGRSSGPTEASRLRC